MMDPVWSREKRAEGRMGRNPNIQKRTGEKSLTRI